jgi:hypothetical protein
MQRALLITLFSTFLLGDNYSGCTAGTEARPS